jgi:hypothetical protein
MVHSSVPTIATDGERLMCGGFSHDETILFGSLEFIADCFGDLSLSPKGSDSGAIFVGSSRSGSPSLWPMMEESTEEFYTTSSIEGGSSLPFSQRHWQALTP